MPLHKKHHVQPNTVLPEGAKLIKPIKRQIGGWVEGIYDAKVQRHGITWLRHKDGFGEHNDREDWVADLPSGALAVHDYQWREPRWGFDVFHSFDEAVAGEMKDGIRRARHSAAEYEQKAARARKSVELLERALKTRKT